MQRDSALAGYIPQFSGNRLRCIEHIKRFNQIPDGCRNIGCPQPVRIAFHHRDDRHTCLLQNRLGILPNARQVNGNLHVLI